MIKSGCLPSPATGSREPRVARDRQLGAARPLSFYVNVEICLRGGTGEEDDIFRRADVATEGPWRRGTTVAAHSDCLRHGVRFQSCCRCDGVCCLNRPGFAFSISKTGFLSFSLCGERLGADLMIKHLPLTRRNPIQACIIKAHRGTEPFL